MGSDLKGFCWITSVAFVRFLSNYNHTLTIRQSMFGRKKGAEVLVMKELSHFEVLTV